MDVRKKIASLKKKLSEMRIPAPIKAVGVTAALLSAPNVSQSAQNSTSANEAVSHSITVDTPQNNNLLWEETTLSVAELQQMAKENNLDIPVEWLSEITPGSSYEGVSSLFQKGFRFTTTRNGQSIPHFCNMKQSPKGYCYGAIKHILEQKFQVKKAPYVSAYQEKDHLLQQSKFLAVRINIEDEDKVPQNSFLVIPKCDGHRHGHICWKKDNNTYVSDGVEKAGANFVRNYKEAGDNVYAFIPSDGSITLTPEMLQQSPEFFAAIAGKQTGQPVLLAALAQTNRNDQTL